MNNCPNTDLPECSWPRLATPANGRPSQLLMIEPSGRNARGKRGRRNGSAMRTLTLPSCPAELDPDELAAFANWKPHLVHVDPLGDLFHEQISDPCIVRIFKAMNDAPQHRFEVLTQRSGRLARLSPKLAWPKNVSVGVVVPDDDYAFRVDHLRQPRRSEG